MSLPILTQKYLKTCFDYCPETGEITWRVRPRSHFDTARIWKARNTRHAGKKAGSVDKSNGYFKIRINGRNYFSHRAIWCWMTGEWPVAIDHKNHIRVDNRWKNLREARQQDSAKNQSMNPANTSGVMGFDWNKQEQKWRARIGVSGKTIHLGYFDDKFSAICARKSAEVKYNFHENHGK